MICDSYVKVAEVDFSFKARLDLRAVRQYVSPNELFFILLPEQA